MAQRQRTTEQSGRREEGMKRLVLIGYLLLVFGSLLSLSFCSLMHDKNDLSAEALKKMMDGGPAIVIIDSRSEFEYKRGHIPGAIFVPEEKFYALGLLLPKEKDTPLVFYCRGYG
jgi:hypothetical protein